MLKYLLVLLCIVQMSFQEQTQVSHQRNYQKRLIKFLNKHQFSLVVSYKERQNWFKKLKKFAFKFRLPVMFLKISDKNISNAFNMYQMKFYPNIRFYMGHPELYVQYMGKFYDSKKKDLEQDLKNFIEERKKNSYSKINNKKTNIPQYINYLFNQNESFIFYKGVDSKSHCFQLFVLFSKSSDKYVISHWQNDVFQKHLRPKLNLENNDEFQDGFYLYKNYQSKNNLMNICNEKQEIILNRKKLLEISQQIQDIYYQPLEKLTMEELDDEQIKFYLIMNNDFFNSQFNSNLSEVTQTYMKNLRAQLLRRLKSFQFFSTFKETQKTVCGYIDSKENLEEYNAIMNMVGYQNRNNFFYVLRRHQHKPEKSQKYQLDLSDPMNISLNLSKLITKIKRKKIKPFLKSGVNKNKQKNYQGLKEIPLNDLRSIVKNNMQERILFYCFKIPNQETLKNLVEFQKKKLLVFLIDMQENEVIEILEGVKDKEEYYLLKEPMSTEMISASWDTVQSPYTWQGPGDEL